MFLTLHTFHTHASAKKTYNEPSSTAFSLSDYVYAMLGEGEMGYGEENLPRSWQQHGYT